MYRDKRDKGDKIFKSKEVWNYPPNEGCIIQTLEMNKIPCLTIWQKPSYPRKRVSSLF